LYQFCTAIGINLFNRVFWFPPNKFGSRCAILLLDTQKFLLYLPFKILLSQKIALLDKRFQNTLSLFKLSFTKSAIPAWIIFTTFLILTIFIYNFVRKDTLEIAETRFSFLANDTRLAIIERMTAYKQILKGGVGLFNASDSVTRDDWRLFIETLEIEEHYPGILGIGFSQYIPAENLEQHLNTVRRNGFPNYRVWPEGKREVYTSIVYLEPFNWRNQRAFGFDMYSEPVRNAAMSNALEKGVASISGRVILVQETEQDVQIGFLMYLPVYRESAIIETVEQRREAILGFVYSPFRTNDLMEGILGSQQPELNLQIFDDGKEEDDLLMFSSISAIGKKDPLFSSPQIVNMNGREWLLKITSSPNFEASVDIEKAYYALAAGIIISYLFFVISLAFINTRRIGIENHQILESTGEGIYGIDLSGNCTTINRAALNFLGYTREECIGKNMHELIHYKKIDGSPYPKIQCPILHSYITKESYVSDEEYFWKKDGTPIPVEYSSFPIFEKGKLKGIVISFTDITERKKYIDKIEENLSEKEVLLKEIHHRVKNNLQIVSSILNLQSNYITDPKAHEIFEESRNRVKSMALIHEKLYQSDNLSQLKFYDYVKDLSRNLIESYNYSTQEVSVDISIDQILVSTDNAIALGLIINELISNSLKYAFNGAPDLKKNKKIHIHLVKVENNIELAIGDNGIGFPDIDFQETDTLGLQLVNSLVDQLNGKIILNKNNGTEFIITFKS
jgi:PAS domain S-box-containing protein